MGDGTWTVGDSQSGCFSDSVNLTILGDLSWSWTVGGVSSDNFGDGDIGGVGECCDSGTCES